MKKKMMRKKDKLRYFNIFIISFFLTVFICCGDERKQEVIEYYPNGKILKTFDGFTTRILDELGRTVEIYGNPNYPDFKTNYKSFYTYLEETEKLKSVKMFLEESLDKEFNIIDSLNYSETIYNYDGKSKCYKTTIPVIDSVSNEINGRKISEDTCR